MEKQLPKNWINVYLQDVTKNVKGKKPKIQSEIEFDGSVPYMDIKALEYKEIRQFADIESSKHFEEGDVAMVWDGARSGWVSKTNFGAIGSTLVAFKPIKINSNYLFYYLLEKYPFINSNARGVGIPHVDPTILWSLDFPLPPLFEQNRIVTRLDALFAQLETIKSSMANVPLLLKDFRQQVLTQAVTGKLTEEWRKGKSLKSEKDLDSIKKLKNSLLNKGILKKNKLEPVKKEELILELKPSDWESCIFDDIFKFIDYRGKTPTRTNEGVRLVTAKNIKMGYLSDNPIEFIDSNQYESWMTRGLPLIGDIFFVTEGHTMGNVALNNRTDKFVLAQRTLTLQSFSEISTGFFFYLIMSEKFQLIVDENATGTAAKGIKAAKFKNLPILFPSIQEQQEIVSRVESLFAKADIIEKQYETLKAKIDNLPQALLHKAFKGELTEQLASDGDASELLKEIEALKAVSGKVKKGGKVVKSYEIKDEVLGMVAEANTIYLKN